jgi:hypothetical protein
MPRTSGNFRSEQAPCGRIVDGETYQDQDEDALVTLEVDYTCGCRSIRHEYHDGSVTRKVVHHSGKVLVDEFLGSE